MLKLTRKMFNRKIVTVGLSAFLGLGLVSTGFAAWVMSMGAEKNADGDVIVSTVTDVSIDLDVTLRDDAQKDNDTTFVFDAIKDDRSGRVKWADADAQSLGENLSITFDVTIAPVSSLDTLTVKIQLPAGVQKAVDMGYLVAPTCTTAVTLYDYDAENANGNHNKTEAAGWVEDEENDSATFYYTITFGWGTKFGGMNPCEYYDETEAGKAVSDAQVKAEMSAFEAILRGATNVDAILDAIEVNFDANNENDVEMPTPVYPTIEEGKEDTTYQYVVTFTATAN